MSDELTICGKITECDGEIVSVAVWEVEEFVPIGSPEHKAMIARTLAEWGPRGSNEYIAMLNARRKSAKKEQELLRITEAPSQSYREEVKGSWWFILFALGLFWLAVGIAFLRRYL